jgi:hypothetical protein
MGSMASTVASISFASCTFVVHVRGAHQDREREAVGVDHKLARRALFAALR